MKTTKEKQQFLITLVSKICDGTYDESICLADTFSEAEEEANDLAVEFSGFTIDSWEKREIGGVVEYTYSKGPSEEYVLTIHDGHPF